MGDQLAWLRGLQPRTVSLRPPAGDAAIRDAEAALRCFLPADYRRFLASSDGATIAAGDSRFDLLPVTRAHGGRRNRFDLVDYNTRVCNRDDSFLVIAIVSRPDEHMGFFKSDLTAPAESCPLYLEWHESGEHDRWAGSFGQFLAIFQG
jgi:hypothetical protein